MPIIKNNIPVREKPTLEEVISRIETANLNAYRALKSAVYSSFNNTWSGDYTPVEVITALCTKYQCTPEELYEVHALSQTLLAKLDPTYQPLVPPVQEEVANES